SYQLAQSFGQPQAASTAMDFYRSNDAGATWNVTSAIGDATPPVKIFTDSSAQNLYVTGNNLLLSQDQGSTWRILSSTQSQFHDGVFSGGVILAAGETGLSNFLPGATGASNVILPQLPIGQFLDVTVDSSGNRWAAGPTGLFSLNDTGISGVGVGSIAAA